MHRLRLGYRCGQIGTAQDGGYAGEVYRHHHRNVLGEAQAEVIGRDDVHLVGNTRGRLAVLAMKPAANDKGQRRGGREAQGEQKAVRGRYDTTDLDFAYFSDQKNSAKCKIISRFCLFF